MNITELHQNFININEEHKKLMAQAQSKKIELISALSEQDLKLADAEHYLEFEKCDAVDMVLIAKTIKDIRQNRRKIKIELDQINCLIQFDGQRDISKYEGEKVCTYKTQVMNDIKKRRS